MPLHSLRRSVVVVGSLVALLAACSDQATQPRIAPSATAARSANGGAIAQSGEKTYPYAWLAYVPCARDGQGDYLQLAGEVTFRWHRTITPSGHVNSGDLSIVSQGTATSLTDGTVYRAPLTNHLSDSWSWDGRETGSNTLRYRFVGPGPGNNYVVESTSVWNVTPDGEFQVWFSDYTVTCGGDGGNVGGSNDGVSPSL